MTYEEQIYLLHLEFMDKYSEYSNKAVGIAKKMSEGQEVSIEKHKEREALFDAFISAFTKHRKLQEYIITHGIDKKEEYKEP